MRAQFAGTTYSLTEDLTCAFIIDGRPNFIRSRIRLDWTDINTASLPFASVLTNSELPLHALFVLLTVLLFYLLIPLDRIHKLGFHKSSLVEERASCTSAFIQ